MGSSIYDAAQESTLARLRGILAAKDEELAGVRAALEAARLATGTSVPGETWVEAVARLEAEIERLRAELDASERRLIAREEETDELIKAAERDLAEARATLMDEAHEHALDVKTHSEKDGQCGPCACRIRFREQAEARLREVEAERNEFRQLLAKTERNLVEVWADVRVWRDRLREVVGILNDAMEYIKGTRTYPNGYLQELRARVAAAQPKEEPKP